MTSEPDIKYFFSPRSVAVIGASHNKEKIGYKIVENLIEGGYPGAVYPVNPEGGEILGRRVYKNVSEVPGEVDMAFIVIPSKYVYDAVRACADKGVKFTPIISSGFSEVGDTKTERAMVEYARSKGMRILGPNIFGVYVAQSSLNGTFGTRDIKKGNIAIITQSGALGISLMGRTAVDRIGLSGMFSVGNKADLDEADLVGYLADNPDTKIILMYVEGVKKGDRLIPVLKDATRKKPVIVIKSGRSKRGAMAAASHTGSLAGSDAVFSEVMKQCGVIRAENIHEALAWSRFLSSSPTPKGENAIIITNGGGMGVLAADACEKYGVNLYDDIEDMKKMFSSVVPSFGSVKNPVDLTGQATIESYEKAIAAALSEENVHSVMCLGCETSFFDPVKLSSAIRRIFSEKKPEKPIVFSFFGGAGMDAVIDELNENGIPAFQDVYDAVSCLGVLYSHYRSVNYAPGPMPEKKVSFDRAAIKEVIKRARDEGRTFLLPHEAGEVATAAGLKIPESFIARNLDEAVKYAKKIGYPVVMKVESRDILHKSDAGGVALDLENEKEVIDAYQAIMYNCRRYNPDAKIDGVMVSEMIGKDLEVIVGAIRDKAFGPLVMFGLGGVYVEVLGDVSFRSYPLTRKELMDMINETKASRLLRGVRGEKRKDIESVVEALMRLGAILSEFDDISDIEVNPLVVKEEGGGAKAVDIRILLSKREEDK